MPNSRAQQHSTNTKYTSWAYLALFFLCIFLPFSQLVIVILINFLSSHKEWIGLYYVVLIIYGTPSVGLGIALFYIRRQLQAGYDIRLSYVFCVLASMLVITSFLTGVSQSAAILRVLLIGDGPVKIHIKTGDTITFIDRGDACSALCLRALVISGFSSVTLQNSGTRSLSTTVRTFVLHHEGACAVDGSGTTVGWKTKQYCVHRIEPDLNTTYVQEYIAGDPNRFFGLINWGILKISKPETKEEWVRSFASAELTYSLLQALFLGHRRLDAASAPLEFVQETKAATSATQ